MYHKILVTGGNGVAGSALKAIQNLFPENKFIFSGRKECDLTNKNETLNYIETLVPDAIIHFAAISGGIGLDLHAAMLRDNVFMNLNILEAARLFKVKKLVMSLSNAMYPVNSRLPIKEEYMHNGYPDETCYAYAFAKRLISPAIKAYRREYNLDVIGLIPNGILGENDNFNPVHASFIPSLIRRFYENRNNNSALTVWGNGSPLREYTYSKDIAKIYIWCLNHYSDAQTLNIGSTELHSVKDIAFFIADFFEIDKQRIVFDPKKPNGIYCRSTDNSKFLKLSNFSYTPFQVALKNTISWFKHTWETRSEDLNDKQKL